MRCSPGGSTWRRRAKCSGGPEIRAQRGRLCHHYVYIEHTERLLLLGLACDGSGAAYSGISLIFMVLLTRSLVTTSDLT